MRNRDIVRAWFPSAIISGQPAAPCALPAGNPPAGTNNTYTIQSATYAFTVLTWSAAPSEWRGFYVLAATDLAIGILACKWYLIITDEESNIIWQGEKGTGLTPAGVYTKVGGFDPALSYTVA